jgi:cytochrome c-type biogenesis protein CcmH
MINVGLILAFGLLLLLAIGIVFYSKPRLSGASAMAVIILFVVGASAGYWQWGAWQAFAAYHRDQLVQSNARAILKSFKSPQAIIDKLQSHLSTHPESARGWYLLGRLNANQGKWQPAFDAFSHAYTLEPNKIDIAVNYAQSLWQLHHQQFTPKIRKLFKLILKQDPNQPDALSMLAIDAYQQHAYQQAIDLWRRLLPLTPPGTAESDTVRQAIAKAQQEANQSSASRNRLP